MLDMAGLRRRLVYLFVAVMVGVTAGLVVSYRHRFHQVYIKINTGTNVSIYRATSGGHYDSNKTPLFNLSSSRRVRLKEGVYANVLSDPGHIYKNDVSFIRVDPYTRSVTINQNYSDQKLASLLPDARNQVKQVLDSKYPLSRSTYDISKDGLYQQGDWYGAVIVPRDPSQDTVRIILHETGGAWVVAADPNIMIGKPSHPDIPANVVEAVDEL